MIFDGASIPRCRRRTNGTTRSLQRVAAAMGALEAAPIVFDAACDIPQGASCCYRR